MEYLIIGFAAGGLVLLMIYFLVRNKDAGYSHSKYINLQSKVSLSDPVLIEGVKKYLSEGKKINAIKYVVENKKVRLIEAKDFVEEIEKTFPSMPGYGAQTNQLKPDILRDKETMKQVIELLKKGNKIEAIKIVNTRTGIGLLEAKEFVESIKI